MLTSAPADCSLISVMTLVCPSVYWLIGERFPKRPHCVQAVILQPLMNI